ncbi:MAG TPA: AmmeMemoRadiSam system protein A [Tepidisphaeraceae bacterium]|nr:AmmeMemoRadiSam system protein A [Tepidisphaeraceae bacterium]
MEFTNDEQKFLLKTACQTIRRRLEGISSLPPVQPLNPTVLKMAGCFVSLHNGQTHVLRGCIGRIDCATPLLQALQVAAWQAAGDPRFATNPVTLAELPSLTVELSILGMLRPAPTVMDFTPQSDGIYLQAANRAGVFLPQVARDTGWSREQLLDRLCAEKLGLPARAWQQPGTRLFTFPATIIGPAAFGADVAPGQN